MNDQKLDEVFRVASETTIRMGFLLLLIVWCFQIILPFASVIVWGGILALAMAPLHSGIERRLGGRRVLASTLIILFGFLIILVLSGLFLGSIMNGAKELGGRLEGGTLTIPPPPDPVAGWPLIGPSLYQAWKQASESLGGFVAEHSNQIKDAGSVLLKGTLNTVSAFVQFILSFILAGILLGTTGSADMARQFFRKLAGERGDEFADISAVTVRNVTRGIIGVALIQAVLTGLGFVMAGVPHAGLWALVVLVLAILQLPATIVTLPIIIWIFSTLNVFPAILCSGYLVLAGLSDNFFKPILLGKGAPVPMLVIFLGVLGGFIMSGFIGLFTGAIIISLGYKLFLSWLETPQQPQPAGH
ncbi:MAG: AI-2E family transporter [Saprospiraceae bacterium]|nr:AI-2E family transporter [Saprospiraceae bacterium]